MPEAHGNIALMSLDSFYNRYKGQSLLWATNRPDLRGECVQAVCFYVAQVWGKPVIWANAADWFLSNALSEHYTRIKNNPNDPDQVPPRGAVIVWSKSLPGSGGYGHIGVVWNAPARSNTFTGMDSNWGGRTLHLVTHDYKYVLGWLIPRGSSPAPQPTPQGGDEVFKTKEDAARAYKVLRPNGTASQQEIDGLVGKSCEKFFNDAQAEVSFRDANLRAQNEQLAKLQATINELNQTITQLREHDASDEAAIKAAQDKIAELTAQLETSHDKITDLQKTQIGVVQKPALPAQAWYIKLLAKFVKAKK